MVEASFKAKQPAAHTLLAPVAGVVTAAGAISGSRRSATHGRRRHQARGARARRRVFDQLVDVAIRSPAERTSRRLEPLVSKINHSGKDFAEMTDADLQNVATALRNRATSGEALDALLPEAFALVREASDRVLGLRHYDVQLMGGAVLHEGGVAEMATGEGKTLVGILPAFLNALSGKGVHVITVNNYLALRDAEWVGQPLRFLGLSVAAVQPDMSVEERRRAYGCDVTYVTNVELCFDYLKDQMVMETAELRLRQHDPFNFAIIDEVDSILIDEARTPLILSGQAEQPSPKYASAREVAQALQRTRHYTLEEKQRTCTLTEDGVEKAEQLLDKKDLFDPSDPWAQYIVNALKAKEFYARDRQYIVRNGEVIIVDEFTGRSMPGRRWSRGLHQAVEAREGVQVQAEQVTHASVTYPSFFRQYTKVAGMTGTAVTEAEELLTGLGLEVSVLPTHRPCRRVDAADVVFASDGARWRAVARAVAEAHCAGRPVLVGTTSVEHSELLSNRLRDLGVPHKVLNAKPDSAAREAEIIAGSGRLGAVTIATNMAGRGTDIILGGDATVFARLRVREVLYPMLFPGATKEKAALWTAPDGLYPAKLSESLVEKLRTAATDVAQLWSEAGQFSELEAGERLARVCGRGASLEASVEATLRDTFWAAAHEFDKSVIAERKQVSELGGLLVVGTQRHDARRIDNQLRGRAGRQGDPGESRFFLSLGDKIFRVFGDDSLQAMATVSSGDEPLELPLLANALDRAQLAVEDHLRDERKQVCDYDQVMEEQRRVLYDLRRRVLLDSDENVEDTMLKFSDQTMEEIANEIVPDTSQPVERWNVVRLAQKMSRMLLGIMDVPEAILQSREASLRSFAEGGKGGSQGHAAMVQWMQAEARKAIAHKEALIDEHGPGLRHGVRRVIMLNQIDRRWARHLNTMDAVQDAVTLRGYGQRNPLTEFKLEGYKLFLKMMATIRGNAVYYIFLFKPQPLVPLTSERLKEVAGPAPEPCGGSEIDAALEQQVLQAMRSSGAQGMVPVDRILGRLRDAELVTRGAQLRFLASLQGVSLLEDEFAKMFFVSWAT